MGGQHMPGDEAWLIGEHRTSWAPPKMHAPEAENKQSQGEALTPRLPDDHTTRAQGRGHREMWPRFFAFWKGTTEL